MLVKDAMQAHAITTHPEASLVDAVTTMQTLQIGRLPVVKAGELVGLLTDGSVRRHLPALREGLTPWAFTARIGAIKVHQAMIRGVLTTRADSPLGLAVHLMHDRGVGGLPVLDDSDQLAGILTRTDVLWAAARWPRMQWDSLQQHMTTAPIVVSPSDLASEAAAKIRITQLKVLPVVEGEHLVGVLHARDLEAAIERAMAAHGDTVHGAHFFLAGKTVGDLMRAPLRYVLDSSPIPTVLQKMLEAQVYGLPVLAETGQLLGVITVKDMLNAVMNVMSRSRPLGFDEIEALS
ncbi:CBS domain-containing protein [Deinococcus navajonensis]|uniref:CBS domain-containing protein n=1 Tax=Deinococcus navajonensis TaxID=309884 RepID=A0ABV8XMB8_9DEIO